MDPLNQSAFTGDHPFNLPLKTILVWALPPKGAAFESAAPFGLCPVKACVLSYDREKLGSADAVIVTRETTDPVPKVGSAVKVENRNKRHQKYVIMDIEKYRSQNK